VKRFASIYKVARILELLMFRPTGLTLSATPALLAKHT